MSSPTPAIAAVVEAGIEHRLHEFEHVDTANSFGREAAEALGVERDRVVKTLIAVVGEELVVGVVPVTGRLDVKALAHAVGGKRAAMAAPRVAERSSGYVVGAISPIGQKRRLRTVVDESAMAWDTVFVSGGRRGLEIELTPADLVTLTDAVVAPISGQP